jgi:hypothetical protein
VLFGVGGTWMAFSVKPSSRKSSGVKLGQWSTKCGARWGSRDVPWVAGINL